jgi:hypothetical protein
MLEGLGKAAQKKKTEKKTENLDSTTAYCLRLLAAGLA